jgi:hypothetical protein
VAFSRDGRYLATGDATGQVYIVKLRGHLAGAQKA